MTNKNVTIDVSGSYNSTTFNKYNVIDEIFGDPDDCNCCFATDNNETGPGWLQMDLQNPYLVYRIDVYGRSDGENFQCKLFNRIFKMNIPFFTVRLNA